MCGIAGFVIGNDSPKEADQESLVAMTRALVHRGPDDEGYHWHAGVGLGSRRLSIIDLSPAGRMPLFNEARTIAVIQNGEIYNFKELRRDLEAKGHQFSSQTDTEVIVHLYEELGEGCFEKFEGMYAIAIWDEQRKKLILARDRFGEKPLYYFSESKSIVFASELRSFLHCPFFTNELDWGALDQFLTLGYILAPRSPFVGTRKLLPGHYLVFDQYTGQTRVEEYWRPAESAEPQSRRSDAEYLEEFKHIFADSVRSRLVSDVPVGAFLSGGIDSSLVVAAMAGLKLGPVRTFSIGFPASPEHNESPFAEEVANILGVQHETLHIELPDVLSVMEKLPDLCDEPIGDTNFICVYLITKLAKSMGVTVMLSGDGGDELFLGYPLYGQIATLRRLYRLGKPLRTGLAHGVEFASRVAGNSRLAKAACAMHQENFEQASYYLTSQGAWTADEIRRLRQVPSLQVNNERFLSAFGDQETRPGPLAQERMALLLTYLPDNNLARMDRASMASSVEARAPFLHPALSDFSARLPMDMQVRGSVLKYVLRQALVGYVPSEIVRRRKHGFNAIPMAAWMRKELGSLIGEFLDPAELKSQGIFDGEFVAQALNEHRQAGRFNHWWKLWLLLVLQMWLKRYAQKPFAAPVLQSLPAGIVEGRMGLQKSFSTAGTVHVAGLQSEL
jgi:asparagine synthase (glutamine-hydrolysing)